MRGRKIKGTVTILALVLAIVRSSPASAQTESPESAKPWTPSRTVDGQPDIQGYWSSQGASQDNVEEGTDKAHAAILGRESRPVRQIVDPPDGRIPYTPSAAAKRKELGDHAHDPKKLEHIDPAARCLQAGVPRTTYMPFAIQILQPPGHVVMLSENFHTYRIIPLEERPRLGKEIKLWMGDSRGRWEGQTLVVETTNQNGLTNLDWSGNFTSDALHVVERFTFVDADTIKYEATLDDPTVYSRPWRMAFSLQRNKQENFELIEYACHEGNRAMDLMIR